MLGTGPVTPDKAANALLIYDRESTADATASHMRFIVRSSRASACLAVARVDFGPMYSETIRK